LGLQYWNPTLPVISRTQTWPRHFPVEHAAPWPSTAHATGSAPGQRCGSMIGSMIPLPIGAGSRSSTGSHLVPAHWHAGVAAQLSQSA
jgi:hypothetical protein